MQKRIDPIVQTNGQPFMGFLDRFNDGWISCIITKGVEDLVPPLCFIWTNTPIVVLVCQSLRFDRILNE